MPAAHGRPSIKDVAERAGVSWKTVTNVIHQRDNVRPQTRARVQEAIDALGYRTNLFARQLQEGRTRVLALAIPETTMPYFGELATRVIEIARRHDHLVVIQETRGDPEREEEVARGSRLHFADGIIFMPVTLDPETVRSCARALPTILIGEREGGSEPNQVVIDNAGSAREAVQHLIQQGRRRLVFVGSTGRPHGTGFLREQGFRSAMADAGLPVPDERVVAVEHYDRASGVGAVRQLLRSGTEVDALVCAVDTVALGAMHGLRLAGVRVPDDVAVLGWDDIEDGRYANPTLTSVAPDVDAVAEAAVTRLLHRIETPGDIEGLMVGHRLVVRESTVGLRAVESLDATGTPPAG